MGLECSNAAGAAGFKLSHYLTDALKKEELRLIEKGDPFLINDVSNLFEDINKLDYEACVSESAEPLRALELWRQGIAMASNASAFGSDPELFYLVGYLSYMVWARTGEFLEETEVSLEKCLKLRPNHALARFYLGCLCFESGSREKAKTILETIRSSDRECFFQIDQEWRYVKALEMLLALACGSGSDEHEIIQLLTEFETAFALEPDKETYAAISIASEMEKLVEAEEKPPWFSTVAARIAKVVNQTRSGGRIRKHFPKFGNALRSLPVSCQ